MSSNILSQFPLPPQYPSEFASKIIPETCSKAVFQNTTYEQSFEQNNQSHRHQVNCNAFVASPLQRLALLINSYSHYLFQYNGISPANTFKSTSTILLQ